jgi:hypothetical protein
VTPPDFEEKEEARIRKLASQFTVSLRDIFKFVPAHDSKIWKTFP